MSKPALIFETTVWASGKKNLATGSGYGINIPMKYRKEIFKRNWKSIILTLSSNTIEVKVTDGFWNKCNEVRDKRIGLWLIENKVHIWKKGFPTKLSMKYMGNRDFEAIIP
ncbi:hypothetical protein [Pseudoalteromonas piscicida]|uniref:hypothetical protein n=1 Tax=Pseudoalteromonas piscicida TaxID=43662 RepID=UPI000E358A0A|nr:hypothetical protein [Pseudoalteromonas piscicida]AXR00473.1 hypothetical protein D0N37_23495 [Pseudoalteromonas piscicida]